MSAIKDGGNTITLKGEEYRLLFTLNALDEIQDKFGAVDNLEKVFNAQNPSWVKDTKWLLTLLINEGILEENETAETLTMEQVGRLIHLGNLREVQKAIFATFAKGVSGDEDGESEEEDSEADDAGEPQGEQ